MLLHSCLLCKTSPQAFIKTQKTLKDLPCDVPHHKHPCPQFVSFAWLQSSGWEQWFQRISTGPGSSPTRKRAIKPVWKWNQARQGQGCKCETQSGTLSSEVYGPSGRCLKPWDQAWHCQVLSSPNLLVAWVPPWEKLTEIRDAKAGFDHGKQWLVMQLSGIGTCLARARTWVPF